MKKLVLFLIVFMSLLAVFGCGNVQESGEYPRVTILAPTETRHLSGELVTFKGSGMDQVSKTSDEGGLAWENAQIQGNDLVWESNIDGQIGIGEEFETDSLSIGSHTITLDGYGYNQVKASASIKILVE